MFQAKSEKKFKVAVTVVVLELYVMLNVHDKI